MTSRQPHTVPARAAPSVAGAAHESLCNNVPERVYEAHDTSTSTTTNSTYIFNRTSTAISVPLFWASGHRFYGRGCDMGLAEPERRRAARRCLRLEMCMETAVEESCMHISLGGGWHVHVPKPTRSRRGCGSAKLYPPEKALHERRDSNCSRRVGTVHEWPWLISATKLLHTIACTHPDTLSLLLSAWYRCLKKVSTAGLSVLSTCNVCWPNGSFILSLALSFGNSLDRSRICADRIARFRFSSCVRAILKGQFSSALYCLQFIRIL